MIDPFEIPANAKPEYFTYQWVRKSLLGKDDVHNMDQSEKAGWRGVPAGRHWNLPAAKMWNADSEFAEYCGLVLMERPDHMTMVALADNRRAAFDMVNGNQQLYQCKPYRPAKTGIFGRLKAVITKTIKGLNERFLRTA